MLLLFSIGLRRLQPLRDFRHWVLVLVPHAASLTARWFWIHAVQQWVKLATDLRNEHLVVTAMMSMLDFAHLPIVDHHAHPFRVRAVTADPVRFQRWFTEAHDATIHRNHVPNTIVYRTAIRWLAELLGCEPTVEAVLVARAAYTEQAFTTRLFEDVNIGMVLCDYGYGSPDAYDHTTMQTLTPCPVYPILRLERLAEELIVTHATFDHMVDAYDAVVVRARADGIVALKSIIAYRTGLTIDPAVAGAARADFVALRDIAVAEGQVRLAHKGLCDYLLHRALAAAAPQGLPVQFHTGFGDADADLRYANPLHLRGVIEQYPEVPLVLLHAGWPYFRELTHLTSIYANVWLDLSLAVPFATTGIPAIIRDILGMAPFSKVLFATDAFTMPEIYWTAARWGRWALTRVLTDFVSEGFLAVDEAYEVAADILGDNARRLYQV
jgi:hypothetical protein